MATKNPRMMRKIRHERVRRNVHGTADRPRLAVFRSLQHMYAQVIDDEKGHTLAAASSKDVAASGEKPESKTDSASRVGALIAARAIEHGVKAVVFDRGGFKYHGRIKALADEARKGGLEF
jgi:large subunit ribosomal protein L18